MKWRSSSYLPYFSYLPDVESWWRKILIIFNNWKPALYFACTKWNEISVHGIIWNIFYGIIWNMFYDIIWNIFYAIIWNIFYDIIWNIFYGIIWNKVYDIIWYIFYDIIWNIFYGIIWNIVYDIIWNLLYDIIINILCYSSKLGTFTMVSQPIELCFFSHL